MAARYWVGGTAAWDGTAGTKWALTSGGAGGQAVPTSADDVFFDVASGANTVTISSGNTGAKSITCTGFTGTLAGNAAISVAGDVTLVSGMGFTYVGNLTLTATGTLTTAGKTLGSVTVNAPAGTVTLGSALTSTGIVTLTAGTLTTSASNYAITSAYIDASGITTRTLTLNGSTITGVDTLYAFYINSTTGITFNAGTSTIVASNGGNIYGDGFAFRNITYNNTSEVEAYIGFSSCATLTLTAPTTPTSGLSYYGVTTSTITTLTFSGTTAVKRIMLGGNFKDLVGTAATLTVTTVNGLSDIDFRDIAFNTSRSGTRLGNCGGNTNITFSAAKTVYWNLTGTQSWGATGWATTSGGTPAVNNFPLAQDTAVFDDTGAATQVNISSPWNIGTLDTSARSTALTLSVTGQVSMYGNITNGSGVTYSGTSGRFVFFNRSPATITSAGKTFTQGFSVNCFGTTLTLQDAFTCSNSNAFDLGYGTFNANGYNLTFTSTGSNTIDLGFTGSRASSATRTFALGSGTLTTAAIGTAIDATIATGLTITGTGTISLTGASAKTFDGNSLTWGSITINQGGAGALTISGSNTLGNITNTYNATGATTIRFTAGTTTTFSNWNASGAATRLLTISSTGAAATVSKSSGVVSADYLSISNSTATGGATWYAGANSTNGGGNTGWIFSAAPSASASFLLFFM